MHNRGRMRRALLLASLLAVPLIGRAQTGTPATGQITFTNTNADPSAQTINSAECSAAPGANSVQLNWSVQVLGAAPSAGITYQLFASNVVNPPNGSSTCTTQSNASTNTNVIAVGQLTNQSSLILYDQTFDPSAIASALTTSGTSACSITTDTTIYLCINALNSANNSVFGVAKGTMTLSTWRPDVSPVLNVPIAPGDGALNPTWSANGTTNTQWYRVQAISVANPASLPSAGAFDPAAGYAGFDPRDPVRHYSGYVSGTQVRIGGLQNGVTYALAVTGYTTAYNASDPSNVGTGTPQLVYDFWDVYKNDGGRETGGCSSGVAGPLGLLVVAGALALVRRRK